MIHHYSFNSRIRRAQSPTGGLADSEHSCPSGRESDFEGDTHFRRGRSTTMDQSDPAHKWRRWRHRRQAIGSKVDSTSKIEGVMKEDRETGWRQSSEAALLRTLRAFERAQRELEVAVGRVNDEKRALSAAVTSHDEWPSGGASSTAHLKQKESRLQRAKCLLNNAAFRFDDVERTLEAAVGALSDEDCNEDEEKEGGGDGAKCRSQRRQRRRASITIEDDAEDCKPPPPSGFLTQSSNSTPPPTTPCLSLCLEKSPQVHELLSDVDDAVAEATKNDLKAEIQLESDTGSSDYSEIDLSEDVCACDEIPVDGEHCSKAPALSQRSANEPHTNTLRTSTLEVHTQSAASQVACACHLPRQHWPHGRDPRHQQQPQTQRPPRPGQECIRSEGGNEMHTRMVSESAFELRLLARLLSCYKSALLEAICLLFCCWPSL